MASWPRGGYSENASQGTDEGGRKKGVGGKRRSAVPLGDPNTKNKASAKTKGRGSSGKRLRVFRGSKRTQGYRFSGEGIAGGKSTDHLMERQVVERGGLVLQGKKGGRKHWNRGAARPEG